MDDQSSSAFFTWLGVVPYLTQEAIDRTLDHMALIQNSEVVFDYLGPPEAFSEELRQLEKEQAVVAAAGNEMQMTRPVISFQAPRHVGRVDLR
jgi:O-methyltransferase involved in polyketide biosynthesis